MLEQLKAVMLQLQAKYPWNLSQVPAQMLWPRSSPQLQMVNHQEILWPISKASLWIQLLLLFRATQVIKIKEKIRLKNKSIGTQIPCTRETSTKLLNSRRLMPLPNSQELALNRSHHLGLEMALQDRLLESSAYLLLKGCHPQSQTNLKRTSRRRLQLFNHNWSWQSLTQHNRMRV